MRPRFCLRSLLVLLLASGVAVAAAGCGRKGALFLPPDEAPRAPQQSLTPPPAK